MTRQIIDGVVYDTAKATRIGRWFGRVIIENKTARWDRHEMVDTKTELYHMNDTWFIREISLLSLINRLTGFTTYKLQLLAPEHVVALLVADNEIDLLHRFFPGHLKNASDLTQ